MRKVETDWMRKVKDTGLIPESEYATFVAPNKSIYDYMRSPECPFDELMDASGVATLGSKKNINTFIKNLKSRNSAIRYWGATGLLILKSDAKPAIAELKVATNDISGTVATLASEALYKLGEKKIAIDTYTRILSSKNGNIYDKIFALNSIDAINDSSEELKTAVQVLSNNTKRVFNEPEHYMIQNLDYLLLKWGLKEN